MIHRDTWLPDVFDDFFNTNFMPRANATAPAINVIENEKDYRVELAAPGLKKEHFNINVDGDGNLHIKMERKDEEKSDKEHGHYLRREFNYTKYEQTLILPDDVEKEKISAKAADGVLTIVLPKIEKQKEQVHRQIEIGE